MHINTTEFFEPRLRDMTLHGLQCPVLLAYWEEDVKRTAVTLLYAYQDVGVVRIDSLLQQEADMLNSGCSMTEVPLPKMWHMSGLLGTDICFRL